MAELAFATLKKLYVTYSTYLYTKTRKKLGILRAILIKANPASHSEGVALSPHQTKKPETPSDYPQKPPKKAGDEKFIKVHLCLSRG
jgi:hypothetical protein